MTWLYSGACVLASIAMLLAPALVSTNPADWRRDR